MKHLTDEQLYWFSSYRAEMLAWLQNKNMFGTMGVLQQVKYEITDAEGFIAAILLPRDGSTPIVRLHEKLVSKGAYKYFRYAVLHEIRHIVQIAADRPMADTIKSLPWPTWADSENKQRVLFQMFSNAAMDTALNEDLRRLLGDSEIENILDTAWEFVAGVKDGKACYLKRDGKKDWLFDQSWVYYLQKMIEEADQDQKDGNGESGYGGFDEHDFKEGDATPEQAETVRQSLREIVGRAVEEGERMAATRGLQMGDGDFALKVNPISEIVKATIRQIKVRVNRIFEGETSRRYSYEMINKLWPDTMLPGHKKHKEKTTGTVLVIDSSGSVVCDEHMFGQLRGIAMELERSKKVLASYCCDTQLHRMQNNTKVYGGGGTVLNREHIAQIRQELNLGPKQAVSFVYLGDGEWDEAALEEILSNPANDLHRLIIPRGRV